MKDMKIETCKKVLQKMNNCHPINKSPNCHLEPDRELSKPNQIHLIMNSRKKSPNCPNLEPDHEQNMSKNVQKSPKASKNSHKCLNRYVQKCPKASKGVQKCPNMPKNVQKRPKLPKCPKASKSIQKCSKMAKHVKKVKIYQNISKHDEIKQKNHFVPRKGQSNS